jgi:iron complex outermembrane recepter protein
MHAPDAPAQFFAIALLAEFINSLDLRNFITMKRTHLSAAIAFAFYVSASVAMAQSATDQTESSKTVPARASASSTSNSTTSNDTQRVQQLTAVTVSAQTLSLGGGLMSVQTAAKSVSTISRDAIEKASPGSNFTQLISSIPGVNSSTDDVTGLNNGNYSIRGFDSSEIGMTVNGAPITDSGNYAVYASEYGDSENIGDVTVIQGIPDIDLPDSGAAAGHIAWATIDPSHKAGVDLSQTVGSYDYRRTFVRLNTGDIGPVRSWISYSDNSANKWRGSGDMQVTKVDGKSIWTIDDNNSISASLQYNREVNDHYLNVTKAQVAQHGYFYDYDRNYVPGSLDTNFYGLHTNPFTSTMFSLDGEFKLSNSLHLSVVPYFWYGNGGGGTGNNKFTETTNATGDIYQQSNQDLNGDGRIVNGTKALTYAYSYSNTWRPGIIAKFNQDLSMDNSLEYGIWTERSRQEQGQTYGLVDSQTGQPADLWATTSILYPNGQPQKTYDEYTTTDVRKGFVTDTWTPTDQLTLTGGLAYLWVQRGGYDIEYPNALNGVTNKYYNPNDTANPCDTKILDVQCGQANNTNVDYHKVLPTAGIKFQINESNQIYYGVGKSFRAPPNTAVFLNIVTGQSPNVPETSWNNDLGYRFYNDTFSASASLYRSNFNNKTESGYDQVSGLTYYVQIPHLKMQGFNGEASYKFAQNWTVYGSYTYTQAEIESNLATGGDGLYPTMGKDLSNTPRNMGYARVGYDDGHLWGSISAQYHSSIYGDYMNTERAGGYTTVSLNGGYTFPSFGEVRDPYIKLNFANILDHRAFTNATIDFLAKSGEKDVNGATLYATSPVYSLLEPRTFMVTVGASFF